MLVFPNSKINIGLNITKKREDGFHNLETVFYPISLSDIIEFVETTKKTSLNNTGVIIDSNPDNNLIIRAYKLLKKDFILPELKIHLHKIIPLGAGLGGGSANASFMLTSLNDKFNLRISEIRLLQYAQKLGSDCPFFIKNKPVFAEGTGNIFTELDLELSSFYIVIIKPDIHISTKEAFREIDISKPQKSIKELIKLPVKEWEHSITNNFEKNIFKLYPEIKNIKDTLYKIGAVYSQMSGSGSSVFGIFENKPVLPEIFNKYFVYISKN